MILHFCNLIIWKFLWLHNLRNFGKRLLSGELNNYLVKPINSYQMTTSKLINGQNLISMLLLILGLVVFSIYQGYSNIILALLVLLFGMIYFVVMFNFCFSFYFFIKNANFVFTPFHRMSSVVHMFTPKAFDNYGSYSHFFYLSSLSLAGFFVVEILLGRVEQFLFYLPYFILIFLFMLTGIYLLWKFGLERYEALG